MRRTLYLEFKEAEPGVARLRYHLGDPEQFSERLLPLASIQKLIEIAELEYYVPRPGDLAEFGHTLYRWLDGADRHFDTELRKFSGKGNKPLALAVSTYGPLDHLPWELLHDGRSFLVERPTPPIVPVRWRPLPPEGMREPPYQVQNRPLRVLFMATAPEGAPPLDYEREEELIMQATSLQPLVLVVEESGNLEQLNNMLASYGEGHFDVVHLTGHAMQSSAGPRFLTETEEGQRYEATAEEIAAQLYPMANLLFISGCRTGEAARQGAVPSLAEALLDQGAIAVLGWGRKVLDREAAGAHAAFYSALSKALSPVEALTLTYRSMIKAKARDWHLLRLYVAGAVPGPLVTPLHTPGRPLATPPPVDTTFLDREGRVRVAGLRGFVGRRREQQEGLRALLHPPGDGWGQDGIFIQGPGGVGKSSLAARLRDRLLARGFQPITWVGDLTPSELAGRLRGELDDPSLRAVLNSEDELRFRLRTVLHESQQRLLFILDNFESNMKVVPDRGDRLDFPHRNLDVETAAKNALADLMDAVSRTGGKHRVIITSRYMLTTSSLRYFSTLQLARLKEADVQKKLARLQVGASTRELEGRAVKAADGNPRLLEWLFDVLANQTLDPGVILDRLDNQEDRFRESVLARELLDAQHPEVRRLLWRALVYALPVPYSVLVRLAEEESSLGQRWENAVALGLLEVSEPALAGHRYRVPRILEPLLEEEFGIAEAGLAGSAARALRQEWPDELEPASVPEEYLRELHRLAMRGGVGQVAVEAATVLAGLLHERGQYVDVVQLSTETLRVVDDYRLSQRLGSARAELGDVQEALADYERALERCPAEPPRYRAAILSDIAFWHIAQGYRDRPFRLLQEALDAIDGKDDDDDKRLRMALLTQLAGIESANHAANRARALYEAAMDLATEMDDPKERAAILTEKAYSLHFALEDDPKTALVLLQEALDVFVEAKATLHQAVVLHNMSDIHAHAEEIAKAEALARQSLKLSIRIKGRRGEAATLRVLGDIQDRKGRPDQALVTYEQARALAHRMGDLKTEVMALSAMANLEEAQGQPEQARTKLREALGLLSRLGEVQFRQQVLLRLARLDAAAGDDDLALGRYEEARRVAESLGDTAAEAATLQEMAEHQIGHGRVQEAVALTTQALAKQRAIGDRMAEAALLLQVAGLARAQGRHEDELTSLQQALTLSEQLGVAEEDVARITEALAGANLATGRRDEARRLLEQGLGAWQRRGDRAGEARALDGLAAIEADEGDLEDAIRLRVRALELYQGLEDHERTAETAAALASLLRSGGRGDLADPMNRIRLQASVRASRVAITIGVGLIPFFDPEQGGRMLAGIQQLREVLAAEHGVTLPPVRIMDDPELGDREYAVFIAGEPVLRREAPTGQALVGPTDTSRWSGRQTAEPGHDQAVVWLSADEAASADNGQVVETTEIILANLKRILQELDPAVLA